MPLPFQFSRVSLMPMSRLWRF